MRNIFRRPEKTRKTREYPAGHVHSLPLELLLEVLNLVENSPKALLNLSLTCSKMNQVVNEYYLYKRASFRDTEAFIKYCDSHVPSTHLGTSITKRFSISRRGIKVAYLTQLRLTNPPGRSIDNHSTKIAGSYDVESKSSLDAQKVFDAYQNLLIALLSQAKCLQDIKITEISPMFEFLPTTYKTKRRNLRSLELSVQSGWSLPFKVLHIAPFLAQFEQIDTLTLHNFILDSERLSSQASNSQVQDTEISRLSLHSCTYLRKPTNGKCGLISGVKCMQLYSLLSESDLSLIDFVKLNNGLGTLLLDLSLPIFYHYISAKRAFNFAKFNLFFKLVCLQKGGWKCLTSLVLVGFDLEAFLSEDDPDRESWHEPTHFEELLQYLSNIPNLDIVLARDWEAFPVWTMGNCNVNVWNSSGRKLDIKRR